MQQVQQSFTLSESTYIPVIFLNLRISLVFFLTCGIIPQCILLKLHPCSFYFADVKLSCVSKYRVRLRERERRKRIARSHSLISTSLIPNKNAKTPNPKRKFAKEER